WRRILGELPCHQHMGFLPWIPAGYNRGKGPRRIVLLRVRQPVLSLIVSAVSWNPFPHSYLPQWRFEPRCDTGRLRRTQFIGLPANDLTPVARELGKQPATAHPAVIPQLA